MRRESQEAISGPVRTCVGCRGRDAKANLVRAVRSGVRVVADMGKPSLPGRGAYVHPRSVCWDQAERKGAFSRSFRSTVKMPTVHDFMLVEDGE